MLIVSAFFKFWKGNTTFGLLITLLEGHYFLYKRWSAKNYTQLCKYTLISLGVTIFDYSILISWLIVK